MKRGGFTLIEILIVISLVAVLMVFLLPRARRSNAVSLEAQAQALSGTVNQAITNRLLQDPTKTPLEVVRDELRLPPASAPWPSLYTPYPGGYSFDCSPGAFLNPAVEWPAAPPGTVCIVDIDKSGEKHRVVTYVKGHAKSHYVNGSLVAK